MAFIFPEALHGYGASAHSASHNDNDVLTALFARDHWLKGHFGCNQVGRTSRNITYRVQKKVLAIMTFKAILGFLLLLCSGMASAGCGALTVTVSDYLGNTVTDINLLLLNGKEIQIEANFRSHESSHLSEELPCGHYTLFVSSPGFSAERRNLLLSDGSSLKVFIGLLPGKLNDYKTFRISGVLADLDDRPVRRATVFLVPRWNGKLLRTTRSRLDGSYQFEIQTPGPYEIAVQTRDGITGIGVVNIGSNRDDVRLDIVVDSRWFSP